MYLVQAQASLNTSRNKMKAQYDKKMTSHQFNVGDYVMLWYPYKVSGLSRTWQPNWKGRCQIHCLLGNCNCIQVNGGRLTLCMRQSRKFDNVELPHSTAGEKTRQKTRQKTQPVSEGISWEPRIVSSHTASQKIAKKKLSSD